MTPDSLIGSAIADFGKLQHDNSIAAVLGSVLLMFVVSCRSGGERAGPHQRRHRWALGRRAQSVLPEPRWTAGSTRTDSRPPTTLNTDRRLRMDWRLRGPSSAPAGQRITTSWDEPNAGWETWLIQTHFPDGGHSGGFMRFAEPSKDDQNRRRDGTLHLSRRRWPPIGSRTPRRPWRQRLI